MKVKTKQAITAVSKSGKAIVIKAGTELSAESKARFDETPEVLELDVPALEGLKIQVSVESVEVIAPDYTIKTYTGSTVFKNLGGGKYLRVTMHDLTAGKSMSIGVATVWEALYDTSEATKEKFDGHLAMAMSVANDYVADCLKGGADD